MAVYRALALYRVLGLVSVALGILGLVFYWWVPFGIMLALAGIMLGFSSWVLRPHQPRLIGLTLGGLLLSAVALGADLFIAMGGLELVKFGQLR
jgi:hypothetical protein